jgi:hypothetical protein
MRTASEEWGPKFSWAQDSIGDGRGLSGMCARRPIGVGGGRANIRSAHRAVAVLAALRGRQHRRLERDEIVARTGECNPIGFPRRSIGAAC